MEGEERIEVGLAALVEVSEIEREDVGEEQEDDDENVRERRREVARELAAHDDAHVAHDAAGPQAVMVRNTSSRRPDSRCSPLSFSPGRPASSGTAGRMVAPALGSAVSRPSRSLTSTSATARDAATAPGGGARCPGCPR